MVHSSKIGTLILATILAVLLSPFALGQSAFAQESPAPSERLQELEFQVGSWSTTTRIVDKSGKVVRERTGREVVSKHHGGLLLEALVYTDGQDEPIQRRWQFFDLYKKRLNNVTFDLVGHFERRVETKNEGQLAFHFPEPVSFQDGIYRDWRKTYSGVSPDSYKVTWEYTEDGLAWTTQLLIDHVRIK